MTGDRKNQGFVLTLFSFIFVAYLLTFSGVTTRSDERFFASAARNLAVTGQLSVDQMYGDSPLMSNYHGVEPAYPLFASFLLQVIKLTEFGLEQSLILLNILLFALCSVLVFLIALAYGYSPSAGLLASLIYSFATLAWPYTQTLFREPLTTVLLLFAWWLVLKMNEKKHIGVNIVLFFSFCAALLGAILTQIIAVSVIPGYVLLLWFRRDKLNFLRNKKFQVISAFLASGIFIIMIWNIQSSDQQVFYRYSPSFIKDAVWVATQRVKQGGVFLGIVGILLSPGKGLFFYSPILILSFISIFKRIKTHPEFFVMLISVFAGSVLARVFTYGEWWWTVSWGSRFLLPAMPFLVIGGLPEYEALQKGKRFTRQLFLAAFGVSVFFQAGAVLVHYKTYLAVVFENVTRTQIRGIVWNPLLSPMVGHWRAFLNSYSPHVLWGRILLAKPASILLFLTSAICVLFLTVYLMRRMLQGKNGFPHQALPLISLAVFVSMIAFSVWTLTLARYAPAYFYERNAYHQVELLIDANIKVGDIVIIDKYLDPLWFYFQNYGNGSYHWYSLPDDAQDNADRTLQLIRGISEEYDRVWFLAEKTSGCERGEIEGLLFDQLSFERKWVLPEENTVCIYLFTVPSHQ